MMVDLVMTMQAQTTGYILKSMSIKDKYSNQIKGPTYIYGVFRGDYPLMTH